MRPRPIFLAVPVTASVIVAMGELRAAGIIGFAGPGEALEQAMQRHLGGADESGEPSA
jgi:hypothetical protein